MSNYTPGPWYCKKHRSSIGTNIETQKKEIAFLSVIRSTDPEANVSDDEVAANARLIAAAPDLLEALVLMMESVECCGPHDNPCESCEDAWEKAEAAIRKAKGEA